MAGRIWMFGVQIPRRIYYRPLIPWPRLFTNSASLALPRGSTGRPRDISALGSHLPNLPEHPIRVDPASATSLKIGGSLTQFPKQDAIDLSTKIVEKVLVEDSKEAKEYYRWIVSSDSREVLELVFDHHKILNKVHIALAIKRLFRIQEKMDPEQVEAFKKDLKESPEFQVLCALLALKASHYEAEITSDMTVFMSCLGVDSDHPSMQIYLQFLKYHLDDLHLQSLARISFHLNKMKTSEQTRLLLKAVGILCTHRSRDLPALNIWQLITLLEIHAPVLDNGFTSSLLDYILEGSDDMGVGLSVAVMVGLSQLDLPKRKDDRELINSAMELMNLCVDRCLSGTKKLSLSNMTVLLRSCKELGVYDPGLCAIVGDRFASEQSTCTERLVLLDIFKDLGYHHTSLVEAFKLGLLQEPDYIEKSSSYNLVEIMDVLSNVITPSDLKILQVNKDKCFSLLGDKILNIWDDLQTSEKESCLLNFALWGEESNVPSLQLEEIHTDVNAGNDAFPSRHHRQGVLAYIYSDISWRPRADIWMTDAAVQCGRALGLALGSHKFVHSPKSTSGDVPIDFVVILNNEGKPTADVEYLNKDVASPGIQPVAVLVLQNNSFHRNTTQLRGHCVLWAKLIQENGMHVAVINYDEWILMPDTDKLPWLRRKILHAPRDQDLWMLPI